MRSLVTLAVLVLVAAPAAADRALAPAAQAHVDAALVAYRAQDYDTASRELEAAYAIDPEPSLLYTWAQARRRAGDCKKALALYRKYLATGLNAEQTHAVKTGIDLCEQPAAPPHKPPPNVVPPPQPPPGEEPAPRAWYRDPIAGAVTGSGVVALGVGIGFVIASNRDRRAAEEPGIAFNEFLARLDHANDRRRIGIGALVVGTALVGGGVALYVLRWRSSREAVVTTDGTAVYLTTTF